MNDDDKTLINTPPPEDISALRDLVIQLQALIIDLHAKLALKEEENAALRKALFGQKSERKPLTRVRDPKGKSPTAAQKKAKRKEARLKGKKRRHERNEQLEQKSVVHEAASDCPMCLSSGPFQGLSPDISVEVEYLGERLQKLLHRVEKKLCGCGHIFSGKSPVRVTAGTHYGPAFHANAVVSKCADAMPLNRISKRFGRQGLHVARSTLTDLYHRAAGLLEPIHKRLLEVVAGSYYVNADETTQPVMDKDKCRRGYIWTFIAGSVIGYIFSPSRSGETPRRLLEGTVGKLQVDGYTGYNTVCVPQGRERIGCIAHCRRYFHRALEHFPQEAQHSLAVILDLYRVEYDAAARKLLGTDAHRLLREQRSQKILDDWKLWLDDHKEKHAPKSLLGKAIKYALNQWIPLTRFIHDAKVRLDNNISEAALRIIALGRDNFRWVGHNESGKNLAVLQTVVATCVANGVNPQDYITDVLIRVQTHPAKRIDELLPMNWKPALG